MSFHKKINGFLAEWVSAINALVAGEAAGGEQALWAGSPPGW